MQKIQKTIAVDFDGVIHKYSKGWQDETIYDGVVEGAEEALMKLKRHGYKVVIHTARAESDKGLCSILDWVQKNLPKFYKESMADMSLQITDRKPKAIAYIDDRAVRFTNWQDIQNYF